MTNVHYGSEHIYITARQQSCGEGMFSQEFVCLSRGPPCDHYP